MIASQLLRHRRGEGGGFICLGRLEALAVLGEPELEAQYARGRVAAKHIEAAARLDRFLTDRYAEPIGDICWPEWLLAQLKGGEPAALLASRLAGWASQEVASSLALARSWPLLDPVVELLEPLARELPPPDDAGISLAAGPSLDEPRSFIRRVLFGPRAAPISRLFKPTFSLLKERRDPSLTGEEIDRGPYYWCLALRESVAAQLCALCIAEYDGLPLAFHQDFVRQLCDEERHARFFLDVGLQLLPEFVANAAKDHPLLRSARAHLETGEGLPVPIEGGLYQLVRNSTLEERLVLMHHDTEAPGVGAFVQQVRSEWCAARPQIARGIDLTIYDESSHARLGRRWLEHLAPDRAERAELIERVRAFRGVNIFAALAETNGLPMRQVLDGVLERAIR